MSYLVHRSLKCLFRFTGHIKCFFRQNSLFCMIYKKGFLVLQENEIPQNTLLHIYYYYKRGNVAKNFHYTMWGPPLPIRIEYDNILLLYDNNICYTYIFLFLSTSTYYLSTIIKEAMLQSVFTTPCGAHLQLL